MSNTTLETDTLFDFQLDEFYLDLQEDGRNISILSQAEIAQMPFPGLRPFKTSEFQLFKGRGGQAEELVKRLKRNRFLAVIGSSGTGKSSLVRAGLIPQLFGGSLYEAGSKWNIAICRPGKNPVANLAIALSSVKGESKNKELLHENFDTIEPLLNSSIYGLLEANETIEGEKEKTNQSNLLIIVDQFEEIFRYDRKDLGRENIENHFVDLLLKAASNAAAPVYVIITMRSEFLGDCVKYRGLPEAINDGQYLVPGLNRTQLKDVIEGPINAAGKSISPGLTELLINEIEEAKVKENLDQLPILQHALMRTYQEAMRQGATEITYEHYSRIGGMEKALAIHAKEKFDELGDGNESDGVYSKKQQIAKIIFQALTDASTDLKGGRRPTELKNIYGIAVAIGASEAEVNEVVNTFRDSDTSFIMPPVNTALHDDLIMDISHESLMRNWDLLKDWIDDEVKYGKFYQRLNERREEDGQFIQGTLLTELVNWRDCYPHNAAWASRYHNLSKGQNNTALNEELYTKNLFFLQRSEAAAVEARDAEKKRFAEEARQQREEDMRQQKERSRKRITWLLTAGLLVAIGLTFWAFREKTHADEKSREAELEKNNALGLSTQLKNEKSLSDTLRVLAMRQRDTALNLAGQLKSQTLELIKATALAQAQKTKAEGLQLLAERQSEELKKRGAKLENHLAEDHLHKEDFYTSKATSPAEKETILPYLLRNPLKPLDSVKIDYPSYIKQNLLQDVNAAIKGREALLDNPVYGLRTTEAVWQRSKNEPVMQSVVSEVFKNNVFHSAKMDLSQMDFLSAPPSVYTTSTDGKRFGFANQNQIVLGHLTNGAPELQDLIETANALQKEGVNGPATESIINALSFADRGTVALLNDSLLVHWQNDVKPTINKLRQTEGVTAAAFAPNGSSLVTVAGDTSVKFWPIANTFPPSPDTVKHFGGLKSFKQAVFSLTDQSLLLVYDNGFGIYDPATKAFHVSNEDWRNTSTVANFTDDGQWVLGTSASAFNYVVVYNKTAQRYSSIRLFASTNDDNFSTARITDLGLSADYKKLLVNQGGILLLYERANGNPLFNPSESYRSGTNANYANLRSRKLFSFGEEIVKAKFLDTATVIALTNTGKAYVWKLSPAAAALDEDFERIRPLTDSTFDEQKAAGGVNLKRLMNGGQKPMLQQAAAYYFNKAIKDNSLSVAEIEKTTDTAKRLYTAVAATDSGFVRIGAFTRLALLSDRLFSVEQNKTSPDTVVLIETLGQATKDREKLLALRPQSHSTREQLSTDYWNLSWLLLFKERYTVAISCAERSVALDPASNGAYTNLALAHLLKGDYPAAEKVYTTYKDSAFADGSQRTFKDSFKQDLNDLETAGVITKDKPALYKEALRIRNEILKEK